MSINTLLKEVLGIANTKKEVKHLLQTKQITINGVNKYDEKSPVGFTDIISIPKLKKAFVITIDNHNYLTPIELKFEDANKKLSKRRRSDTTSVS